MGRADSTNVFYATVAARSKSVRDVTHRNTDTELEARHRAEWPELWAKLDELFERIDW